MGKKKNRSISVVHSKLTGWLCGGWWSYKTMCRLEWILQLVAGETRGTSHEAASNHLTRLEVNYVLQQIDMHKSFREKEKRATL